MFGVTQPCSSADVCQRGTMRQRMVGGNTPRGVSPHPQGAWLTLRLVCLCDGIHYPVGQCNPPGSAPQRFGLEPHDEIMLSQGPAIHCIVVGRDSGHIHFKVEGDSLRSNLSCRKESTTTIIHLQGSCIFGGRQLPPTFWTATDVSRTPLNLGGHLAN